jgi:hypothetical protein
MDELLVAILSAVPCVAGACLGCRLGAVRLLAIGLPLILAWALGIESARWALAAGWYQPFGLVTPLLVGLLAALVARRLASRLLARRAWERPSAIAGRAAGAILGAGCGMMAAATLWVGALLVVGTVSTPAASPRDETASAAGEEWIQALLRTANHGFVRHLPVVGELGDEVEALTIVLRTAPETRARLALALGWEKLADLPTFRAILRDRATLEDIDRVGEGDIAALYRLQKNPLIVAFFREHAVQEVLVSARPSRLARELAAIEASLRPAR